MFPGGLQQIVAFSFIKKMPVVPELFDLQFEALLENYRNILKFSICTILGIQVQCVSIEIGRFFLLVQISKQRWVNILILKLLRELNG